MSNKTQRKQTHSSQTTTTNDEDDDVPFSSVPLLNAASVHSRLFFFGGVLFGTIVGLCVALVFAFIAGIVARDAYVTSHGSKKEDPALPTIRSVFVSVLNPGDTLFPGMRLQSANGKYYLMTQSDGNLVLYQKHGWSEPTACWAAGTNSYYKNHDAKLTFQHHDGNLVLYSQRSSEALWHTGSHKSSQGMRLTLSNDGILALMDANKLLLFYASCQV